MERDRRDGRVDILTGEISRGFRLLSLAAGPASELDEIVRDGDDADRFDCTLLDQDPFALDLARETGRRIEVANRQRGRGRGNAKGKYKNKGYRTLHVPRGHYPPPGACRVWYAGRPPGHQPRPVSCNRLYGRAPYGAFILYNGEAWDSGYDWRGHARRHPGSVPKVIIEVTSRR